MSRKRKKAEAPHVEPDLPITPMLDMAFQLLAFFVMTFNPTPPEGHLDMSLPKLDGGDSAKPPPSVLDDDDELIVVVDANANGEIANIKLRKKDEAGEGRPLGNDSTKLYEALKAMPKKGKVKLEMADNLVYKIVIKLMDEITRAGFKQVAPALHMPGKK